MKKIVLTIDGMTCSACSSGLEKYLKKQKGIYSANVNLVLSIATIEYDGPSEKQIEAWIHEAGFASLGEFKGIEVIDTKKIDKIKLILFGFVVIAMMYISMGHMLFLPEIPYINSHYPHVVSTTFMFLSLLFLWYGFDIIKSGIKNLIHKMPNMDTLVMFSVLCSFFYSLYGYFHILEGHIEYFENLYFESTCVIVYFVKLGRYLETISKDKTKDAIKKLVQITPQNAILKENGIEKKVTIDEIRVGNILVCRAGDKIAVDGSVVNGKTYVDESFITGESIPVLKEKSSKVIAGSICYDGYIEYQAERIGKDSTISEIVKLVVEATNTKGKIQKLADKISSYFVPMILVISLFTFMIQLILGLSVEDSLIHMITILVVACPCSLGLAVPLVVVVSNGLCAKKGLFLRNSEVLEKAKDIDTVVFDKTGTLTFGKLNIFKVYHDTKYKKEELLNIVANLEEYSTHPIKTAFILDKKLEVEEFKTLNGMGITGIIGKKKYYLGNEKILKKWNIENQYRDEYEYLVQNGCSIVYVIEDRELIGLIGVRDVVRSNVENTIQEFKKYNIEVIMLTGDNEITANRIATELGVTRVIANVLPDEKCTTIEQLIQKGKKVIMVGDGINDAPALVKSTIGISINDGTDIAMDSSDVILMNNDMNNILDLIRISKRSYRMIRENLFWAFFYNLCMIPIAGGFLRGYGIEMNPMFGSVAMTLSSLTVVLNSLRLGRMKNE